MNEKDDIKLIGYKEVDEIYLKRKRIIKIWSICIIILCLLSYIMIGTICGIFLWQKFYN